MAVDNISVRRSIAYRTDNASTSRRVRDSMNDSLDPRSRLTHSLTGPLSYTKVHCLHYLRTFAYNPRVKFGRTSKFHIAHTTESIKTCS